MEKARDQSEDRIDSFSENTKTRQKESKRKDKKKNEAKKKIK